MDDSTMKKPKTNEKDPECAVRFYVPMIDGEMWVVPKGWTRPLNGPTLRMTFDEVLAMKGWTTNQIRVALRVKEIMDLPDPRLAELGLE